MKDLPVLMKSGEGNFLVPIKITATVNSHSSCQVPWLTLCQPLHPSSHSTLSAPRGTSAIITTICSGRKRPREVLAYGWSDSPQSPCSGTGGDFLGHQGVQLSITV